PVLGPLAPDVDLLVARGAHVLALDAQLFVELFPRPDAGEDDFDVLAGAEAGERNHFAREVQNLHWLAHIKDEDLATAAHCAGLQYELCGFRNGHEIARHVRMSNGHGSAAGDLLAENGDDAARRAQDVSKAHSDEMRFAALTD